MTHFLNTIINSASKKTTLKNLLIFSVILGSLIRIFIILTMPPWGDELYSVDSIKHTSAYNIHKGLADEVHPPGYYIFLKSLGLISYNLIWLRSSGTLLFYLLNLYLINKLIQKTFSLQYAHICTSLYALSGYFFTFDWQLRMYTSSLSIMLLSSTISLYNNSKTKVFFLPIVNLIGLYYSYSFAFFLTAQFLISTYYYKNKKGAENILSCLISLAVFIPIFPNVITSFNKGLNGIEWAKEKINPNIFIPFFSGTQMVPFLGSILALISLYYIYKNRSAFTNKIKVYNITILIISTLIIMFSILYKPLFHLRALQIIGFGYILWISYYILVLFEKKRYLIANLAIFMLILNSITNFIFVYKNPEKYEFELQPWFSEIKKVNLKQSEFIGISDNLIFYDSDLRSINYYLEGHFKIFGEKIPMKKVSDLFLINCTPTNIKFAYVCSENL